MRYTLLALALVSATLALPTDLSSQKSAAVARETNFEPAGSDSFPYQRDVQDAQETTAKDFDGPFGPGLPNGVAFRRDLTGTKPFVKRDNQDA
ncbi:Dipeptidyl peptidase IV (DPP IV) N-terminal region family protein [Aspergillus niger]|uniref:Dipeptidyl peptidase IV (DPP IV) N-terminal region family protein n=1 Tax=Aspergillus niger TaxID=5061 RepID=A0A505IK02_ASPNG|nr:Dipeptidyl peptidase IV (DPP IV) N-terminal region family protein [Aspergillus niger]